MTHMKGREVSHFSGVSNVRKLSPQEDAEPLYEDKKCLVMMLGWLGFLKCFNGSAVGVS